MSYRSFSLGWGWRMNSGRCVRSECPARQTKGWGGVGRSLGRGSSGTGCWCSWDGDPLCDCCRWLPAAHPESSGPSSHTRRGTDTSCTYKVAFHMNHTLSDIKQVQVSAKCRRSESNKSLSRGLKSFLFELHSFLDITCLDSEGWNWPNNVI